MQGTVYTFGGVPAAPGQPLPLEAFCELCKRPIRREAAGDWRLKYPAPGRKPGENDEITKSTGEPHGQAPAEA